MNLREQSNMKNSLTMLLVTIVLIGCSAQPIKPVPYEPSQASKAATKKWGLCVYAEALRFDHGSDDVRLIVDTAMGVCEDKLKALYVSIADDGLPPNEISAYMRGLTRGTQTDVTSMILRNKSNQKK